MVFMCISVSLENIVRNVYVGKKQGSHKALTIIGWCITMQKIFEICHPSDVNAQSL